MGSVVGEKIARLTRHADRQKSGRLILGVRIGRARMQEGVRRSCKWPRRRCHRRSCRGRSTVLSVLTNPTTAAFQPPTPCRVILILAEPGAVIGFADRA